MNYPFPLSRQFADVPAEAWAPYRERYPETFSNADSWRGHYGAHLIRSQGRTILVDTGAGSNATSPGFIASFLGGSDGILMEELEAAGVRTEEVDTVFFTHFHPDHVGWNLTRRADGTLHPTFPKARYVAHQTDWDYFCDPEVQRKITISYMKELVEPLEGLGVLDLISGEHALTSEVTAFPTPGHTPGHMSVAIVSAGQRAIISGDVAIHPAQVTETDWNTLFDVDKALAAKVRRQFLDRVEAEEAILVSCHFPAPGYGRLVRIEGRRYWQAL